MNLNTNPSFNQLREIKLWLVEEDQELNQGFYCNWNIIENSFNHNRLFTFEVDEKTVGFISWTKYSSPYVSIDIMEVHPNFRKRGMGRAFYLEVEEYFKSQQFKAIKLFCSPRESEKFWRRMKFIKYPNTGYSEQELSYYKPLIRISIPTNKKISNKIELWDMEPYRVEGNDPKWIWEVQENQKPILHPCNPNWNLRLTLNGKMIKEEKVKYFSRNKTIEIGPFLFIETFQ